MRAVRNNCLAVLFLGVGVLFLHSLLSPATATAEPLSWPPFIDYIFFEILICFHLLPLMCCCARLELGCGNEFIASPLPPQHTRPSHPPHRRPLPSSQLNH